MTNTYTNKDHLDYLINELFEEIYAGDNTHCRNPEKIQIAWTEPEFDYYDYELNPHGNIESIKLFYYSGKEGNETKQDIAETLLRTQKREPDKLLLVCQDVDYYEPIPIYISHIPPLKDILYNTEDKTYHNTYADNNITHTMPQYDHKNSQHNTPRIKNSPWYIEPEAKNT